MIPNGNLYLIAVLLLVAACKEQQEVHACLDGVYYRTSGFENEVLVLQDDRFEWWFSMDEPLPDVYPLKGKFMKRGNRLDLTYENPPLRTDSMAFPPHYVELVEHPSPLMRSHRFIWEELKDLTDETEEEFEAANQKEDQLLFKTKLQPGDELDPLWAVPSLDLSDMLVDDQRDRYRRRFDSGAI